MAPRSPEEIRSSVEETRRELTFSLNDLQGKVDEITDWRSKLRENRDAIAGGAAVAGFVVGGGIAAAVKLVRSD
jgi:hypothetical protein